MTVPICETLWLTGITEVSVKEHPQMPQGKILTLTLQNGRQYVIPLQGDFLRAVQRGLSPIHVVSEGPPSPL